MPVPLRSVAIPYGAVLQVFPSPEVRQELAGLPHHLRHHQRDGVTRPHVEGDHMLPDGSLLGRLRLPVVVEVVADHPGRSILQTATLRRQRVVRQRATQDLLNLHVALTHSVVPHEV